MLDETHVVDSFIKSSPYDNIFGVGRFGCILCNVLKLLFVIFPGNQFVIDHK